LGKGGTKIRSQGKPTQCLRVKTPTGGVPNFGKGKKLNRQGVKTGGLTAAKGIGVRNR